MLARPAPNPSTYPTWMKLFMFCVFWSCTAFSIVLPSLAPYLDRMGAQPIFLSYTIAVFSFGEMVGAIFFGWLYNVFSDFPTGPTNVLCLTISCGIMGSVLYVLADAWHAPWMAFLGRGLTGLWTGGKQSVEQAYMASHAPREHLTEYTADLGTCAVLGFTCGPLVGAIFTLLPTYHVGWLRVDQFTGPGLFLISICLASLTAVWFYLPGSKGEKTEYDALSVDEAASSAQAGAAAASAPEDASDIASTAHVHRENCDGGEANGDAADGGSSTALALGVDRSGIFVCMGLFFVHYFNFAIQETMVTPFVLAAYQWNQTYVNLLFVGVGLFSLAASLAIKYLSRCCSDITLINISIGFGLLGSLLLIDSFPGACAPKAASGSCPLELNCNACSLPDEEIHYIEGLGSDGAAAAGFNSSSNISTQKQRWRQQQRCLSCLPGFVFVGDARTADCTGICMSHDKQTWVNQSGTGVGGNSTATVSAVSQSANCCSVDSFLQLLAH